MTTPFVIEFCGEPVAKGRPRFASIGGKPRAYSPAKTRHYEAALQYAAQQAMDGRPLLVGALSMSIVASLPVPQSWSNKKRVQALAGKIAPTKRPDVDNYAKIAADALNAVVFLDDSQITFLMVSKVYGERPSLRIEVSPLALDAEQKASEAA
jgi:Holliday junction resolvase RusA-like endonuclease